MSYSDGAAAGALAGPFWEMLALLAQEPGIEWLQGALAGQADPFSRLSQGAARRTAAVVRPGGSRQCGERGSAGIGREISWSQKHSLGPWPLKTLSLLECSGDGRFWQACLEGLKKFLVFRRSMGMPAAWPIPKEQVRGFLTVESLYSSSKALVYAAGLVYLSKLTGNSDPLGDPITRFMVIGLKRRAGILRDKYLPVTIEVLRSLLGALESVCITHYECLLFRALFTVAFFGALRIGEMVAKHRGVLQPELLHLSDLQLMERRVAFHLRNFSVGQERHVISLGLSEEPWVCPVLAVQNYMIVRSQLEGPLFIHLNNTAVTKRDFLSVFRGALRLLGLCPEQYGVHSFWLGTAVTATRCGYPWEDVTRLARWPCMVLDRP
ncbi:uncharacterized protein LOC133226341 [Neopsephotus bourkii]|uniref:uncharacterized protein LOC133226341 n=1 Tax=Neopsephotus bourkii TaxID=309878 RepID=UPI002AA5D0AD|nr:uncharacterized protein LOC133226341 [Neopsephotus bourkii]